MSANDPRNPFAEFDGETYGKSHGYRDQTGEFKRGPRGDIRMLDGPVMVANHLVRTLRTPVGDDPFRPQFGLDRQRLLGRTVGEGGANIKQAIIDAIGPGAIPWVERLAPDDIDLDFDAGNRVADITITARLADGTPVQFALGFEALLGQEDAERATQEEGPAGEYVHGEERTGFGYAFGESFGE